MADSSESKAGTDQSDVDRLLTSEVRHGVCVVRFVEPVLRDSDRLEELKQTCLQLTCKHRRFVVNMTVVRYCSSIALSSLVLMRNTVTRHGGRVHLCGVSGPLADILTATGLDELFSWFDTEEEALADLVEA